jgi:multisubunit Na+/H+ antiporter MnhC subunit
MQTSQVCKTLFGLTILQTPLMIIYIVRTPFPSPPLPPPPSNKARPVLRPLPPALFMLAALTIILFAFLAFLFLLGFFISSRIFEAQEAKKGFIALHIPNAGGAILGYCAVFVIVSGVSNSHCLAAPILMDLSLLICGGKGWKGESVHTH